MNINLFFSHLVKVSDDLVKKTQAFGALVVDGKFSVELMEVRDGSKHHPNTTVTLVIQVLQNDGGCVVCFLQ